MVKAQKVIPIPRNRDRDFLELIVGFEPTTCSLRVNCSTYWAISAIINFFIFVLFKWPTDYEWAALPTEPYQHLFNFSLALSLNRRTTLRLRMSCSSLRNIVALLAWGASYCSLFLHLILLASSSTGRARNFAQLSHISIYRTKTVLYFSLLYTNSLLIK